MSLSEQQTIALADRFDHVALWIASALEFESVRAMQSTCDRLIAICRRLREEMPPERDGNDAWLMLHIVVALQAAIVTRVETHRPDAPEPAEAAHSGSGVPLH